MAVRKGRSPRGEALYGKEDRICTRLYATISGIPSIYEMPRRVEEGQNPRSLLCQAEDEADLSALNNELIWVVRETMQPTYVSRCGYARRKTVRCSQNSAKVR
jgi:hypothetical protein